MEERARIHDPETQDYSQVEIPGDDRLAARIPAVDPIAIRFRDPTVEVAYHEGAQESHQVQLRISFIVGIAIWLAFGWLDAYVGGGDVGVLWTIRYVIVLPILLLCLAALWRPLTFVQRQGLISIGIQAAGLGVLAMMVAVPAVGRDFYFNGLVTVIVFCCCVMRPNPKWAVANCLIVLVAYCIYKLALFDLHDPLVVNNIFFLTANITVVVFATYLMEILDRKRFGRDFALARWLKEERGLRQEAEQASRLKSQLLAVVSHELRTPLNSVIGFSEMLKTTTPDRPLAPEDVRDYAHCIHESGSHLLQIVDDLLDVSRAEAGRLGLDLEMLDVRGLVRWVVRVMAPQAAAKGLTLAADLPEDPVKARVDERLLRRVLDNLVANAIKFTENGCVTLALANGPGDTVSLTVTDTGHGIPEDKQEFIFEIFAQGDARYARKHGGAGLGVALVKRIVELHHGRVAVDSVPGKGATFTVVLPVRPDEQPD